MPENIYFSLSIQNIYLIDLKWAFLIFWLGVCYASDRVDPICKSFLGLYLTLTVPICETLVKIACQIALCNQSMHFPGIFVLTIGFKKYDLHGGHLKKTLKPEWKDKILNK